MKSSVLFAALAASLVRAEPEAHAEPEPLPFPAPQRQAGALLGILGLSGTFQGKGKTAAPKGGGKCACPRTRQANGYCKNNNEVGSSSFGERDLT